MRPYELHRHLTAWTRWRWRKSIPWSAIGKVMLGAMVIGIYAAWCTTPWFFVWFGTDKPDPSMYVWPSLWGGLPLIFLAVHGCRKLLRWMEHADAWPWEAR
jgi:hypothetical protein